MDEYNNLIGYIQNKQQFDEHYSWVDEHIEKHFPDADVKVFHETESDWEKKWDDNRQILYITTKQSPEPYIIKITRK